MSYVPGLLALTSADIERTEYTWESRAAVALASIDADVDALRTLGYATPGDGGGALYKRVGSEPSHAGKVQSLDGAWWEIAETVANVKMFGAVGDNSTDDTTAIQDAITAYAGKTILIPAGSFKITSALVITSAFTRLVGLSSGVSYVFQHTANEDGLTVKPATAGTVNEFLSGVLVEHINFASAATYYNSATSGAGVRLLQCNGAKIFHVSVNNYVEGISVEGGQLNSLKSFQVFASVGTDLSASETALLNFKSAPLTSGRQPMYTTHVEDFRLSASLLRRSCVYITDADGLKFSNGYIALGGDDLVQFRILHNDDYVGAVSFTNVYLDCVGTSQTPTAVTLQDDALTNTNMFNISFGAGCIFGNGDAYGVRVLKPETMLLQFDGCQFVNFNKAAILSGVQGSTTLYSLMVNGCQFQNCGTDGTGPVIDAQGGMLLSIIGNTFQDSGSATAILTTGGTWNMGTVCGNANNSNLSDIGNSATYTYGYTQYGNVSRRAKGSTGSWVVPESTVLGYATATQGSASGKATTVTINAVEGVITTDTATLNAGTTVRFQVTNNTIRASDMILLRREAGGSGSTYDMWVDSVFSGGFFLCLRNTSAFNLGEAVQIRFKVLRSNSA